MAEIGLMESPATKKQAIGAECEREYSYLATKSIDYESDTKAKFTGFNWEDNEMNIPPAIYMIASAPITSLGIYHNWWIVN